MSKNAYETVRDSSDTSTEVDPQAHAVTDPSPDDHGPVVEPTSADHPPTSTGADIASAHHGADEDDKAGPESSIDQSTDAESTDAESTDAESTDAESTDAESTDAESTDAESAATDRTSSPIGRLTDGLSRLRPPKSRGGRIAVALLAGLLLVAAAGGIAWAALWRLPDGTAFRADGQDVSVEALNSQMDTMSALYGVAKPQDPAKLGMYQRDFAKGAAIGMVIDRAAADRGIVVAERAAQDFLGQYIARNLGDGDQARAAFVEALGNAGTSEPEVLGEIKRQMVAAQLFQQVTADVPAVTDSDVDAAFQQRRDLLATPERRAISNIVTPDENTARQALNELRAGAPFANVVRTRSADGASRDSGGAIGTLAAMQLEKPFADAAFGAAPNTPFGPVRTEHGWNVGVVTGIQPGAPADPKVLHEPLRQRLLGERRAEAWRTFLGGELDRAGVRYADGYQPPEPDSLPTDPSALTPPSGPGN